MVITEEREKKQSAFLKSSSLSHNDSQLSVGSMTGEHWSSHHNGMASRQSVQTRDNAFATGGVHLILELVAAILSQFNYQNRYLRSH